MTTFPPDRGVLEVIVPEPGTVLRWHSHDYPHPLARWHHHPEAEFHLIRRGTGLMMAGDALVPFAPGQVALMGEGLPHNWISDLAPGEVLPGRDVVCQVLPSRIAVLAEAFPEMLPAVRVLARAAHGTVLTGSAALVAAGVLERMGNHAPMERVVDLLTLFQVFADADEGEWHTVVTPDYSPDHSPDTAQRLNTALALVSDGLASELRLEDVADAVAMSPAAFSRFFHRASGITFSDLVRRMRISRACHLLVTSDLPVSRVQEECGYSNASNFNRRFRQETGVTPSVYRRLHTG